MDRFFSFFGKLALIFLIVAVLVGGGYYLGTGKLPFPMNPAPGAVTTIALQPTQSITSAPFAITPTTTIATSAGIIQTVSVASASGTSFRGFTISVPSTWTVKKDENPGISVKVTINRGDYSMSIYQAATGGAQCLYPGDTPADMSTSFGPFTFIQDASGTQYRRARTLGSASGYTICQKSDTTYGLPTSFGHVTYTSPANPDPEILKEMDTIFATIKKT